MRCKILPLVLVLWSALPSLARDFEYTYEGQTITYTVLDEAAKTVSTKAVEWSEREKLSGELVLPAHPKEGDVEYTLTTIEPSGFYDCVNLTGIKIPNTVTSIGDRAFLGCYYLSDITVEDGNPTYASVDGVLFNADKTTLLFYPPKKEDTSYDIPNSVTSIGYYAFEMGGNMTSINIPKSVVTIACDRLGGSDLAKITVEEGNPNYSSADGVLFNADKTVLIQYPTNKGNRSYSIPDSVIEIGAYAFSYCQNLANLIVANSVRVIREYAIDSCYSLIRLSIGDKVESIYHGAFDYCDYIKDVTCLAYYPPQLGPFSLYGIYGEKLGTLYVHPNALAAYESSEWADYFSSIEPCSYPRSFTYTYENQTLTYAVVDEEEKTCQVESWYDNTGHLIIPEVAMNGDTEFTVTTIGEKAFYNCRGLTQVELPNSLTTISDGAFANCSSLSLVDIPESVTSIGWCAFENCNFSSVYIPASVSNIGPTPFMGCGNLKEINVDSCNGYYSSYDGILLSKDETELIQWPEGKHPVTIPSCVKKIGRAVFNGRKDLTTIEIPNSVVEIGEAAFFWSGITSIAIPNSVTVIAASAFRVCQDLTQIYIPSSVKTIGDNAFDTGTVQDIVEYESIESMASINYDGRFANPQVNAKSIYIKGEKITDLIIPNTVSQIKSHTFIYAEWTSITIPESVITIDAYAFSGPLPELAYVSCLATTPPAVASNAFGFNDKTLYVPKGSVEAYRNSDWAQYFSDIREIENSLTVEIDGGGKVYASVFNEVMNGQKVSGLDFTFFILPDKDSQVASIMLDDEDVTDKLIGHHLTLTDYNGNGTLKITFEPEQEATLTVRGADNHSVTHTYKEGSSAVIRLQPEEGWELHSVTYNGEDITDLLNDNMFVSEPLHGSNNLNMVLVNTPTDLDEVSSTGSGVRISVSMNKVTIHGLAEEETVSVYDMSGSVVYSGFDRTLTLNSGNVYILTTPSKTFKIAI